MLTNNINIETKLRRDSRYHAAEVLYRPYSQVWFTKKGLLATTATCRSNMELQNLRGLPTTAHIAQLVERPASGRIPGGRGFESRCGQIFIFVYKR